MTWISAVSVEDWPCSSVICTVTVTISGAWWVPAENVTVCAGRLERAVPVEIPGIGHGVVGRVATRGGELDRAAFLDDVRTAGIDDGAIAVGVEADDDRVVVRHAEAVGRVEAVWRFGVLKSRL